MGKRGNGNRSYKSDLRIVGEQDLTARVNVSDLTYVFTSSVRRIVSLRVKNIIRLRMFLRFYVR